MLKKGSTISLYKRSRGLFQQLEKKTGTAFAAPVFLYYFPASARKVSALSVRSHGRSTSVRPKWPYAAVCL